MTNLSGENSATDVTRLLLDWGHGEKDALDLLLPLIYNELRRVAESYLRRDRQGHTLQATALVNEAFLRLIDQNQVNWQNRAHFFGAAANLMRQILIQHARANHAAKRGGERQKLYLDEAGDVAQSNDLDLVVLDDALRDLEASVAVGRISAANLRARNFCVSTTHRRYEGQNRRHCRRKIALAVGNQNS